MNVVIIALTQPEWLKWSFDVLLEIFEWVGLQTNFKNTVGMVYYPCHIFSRHSDAVYKIHITGGGQPGPA